MSLIDEREEEIIEEFSFSDDWLDIYQLIIDKGNDGAGIDARYKDDSHLIEGCQSKVWVNAELVDGKVYYQGESNTEIVNGIVSILVYILSGNEPQDILDAKLTFIDKIGLQEHLTPTRSNGMLAMIKQMRLYAMAFAAQQQK
ncbi:MAG: SufE family protein [Paludibacteraceae bacterium]|jgi:cysteine desulfuration protein SufE|nr:SufE family protein [Paludibacteraceae bacterium]MDD5998027.1 SufE family protein [Bacteroidales bacterium]MBQ6560955.1 SufE family protein [Paludibacteraceae bacterium]MBQ8019854.1 SufE family protein [Paludibacteraceae bacterium]MBR6112418.1 SufE family protein [Paludibacteraceae bacterium]